MVSTVGTFDFFHFVPSSFLNNPFPKVFVNFLSYFVCFLTEQSFSKIVHSIKSFVQ